MLRILHKEPECIGCDACVEAAPMYFRMGDEGRAELVDVVREGVQGVFVEGEGIELDLVSLEDAEDSCPVQIIEVSKKRC